MRILSRAIFREIVVSALLGGLLFTFVLFLHTMEKLFALLVRSTASPLEVAKLLLFSFPSTVPFALPLGVLVGILIGLSRMSADGEITAMRAAGVPSTAILRPVALFSVFALVITALTSLWLSPLCLRRQSQIARHIAAAQLTTAIEPRVFNEDLTNTVLYIGDVSSAGKQVHWSYVFMADTTPQEDLQKQGKDRSTDMPRVTVAAEAIVTPDIDRNQIQLNMRDVHTIEQDKEGHFIITGSSEGVQVLQAQKPDIDVNHVVTEMDTRPLYRRVYKTPGLNIQERKEGAIEFHQRFALPFACLLLAFVGVPLGISSRKGGKSTAFVVTVLVAFVYYLGLITLLGLARKGNFPVWLAAWAPNALFALAGVVLVSRLERPGDRDFMASIRAKLGGYFRKLASTRQERLLPTRLRSWRSFGFRPMLMDGYVLNGFCFYFALILLALVLMTEVFTFFELLSDMVKNNISMTTMLDYLFHLAPQLIYESTPMAVLVATLICFGVLTKHNEITAFKAGGISVYRLTAPVLVAAFVISGLIFAFDFYYIPGANRRQEALRSIIKNRPVQTYLRPDRQWVAGEGSRIYYYKFFDVKQRVMYKPNVYELDPKNFHMVHQISAERAQWEPSLHTWVFQNGLSHDAHGDRDNYQNFSGKSATFKELTEPPSWFAQEEKQYKEMNFEELAHYIREVKASGLDTIQLRVEYHRKFAVPLFALIMALLSIPFAFVAGNRGAMTGVGISFAIAIAYWTLNSIFIQVGDLNQLPAAMAAWSPDALFSLAGMWFMSRMRT